MLLTLNWPTREVEIRGSTTAVCSGTVTECAADVRMSNDTAHDYADGREVTVATRGRIESTLTLTVVRHSRAPADPLFEWLRAFATRREPNIEIQVVNASYPSGLHVITQVACSERLAEDGHARSFRFERLHLFKMRPPPQPPCGGFPCPSHEDEDNPGTCEQCGGGV